jgi:prophage antirepressor-like protein
MMPNNQPGTSDRQSATETGMDLVVEFRFQGRQVRTVVTHGGTWFVASDVCAILENANPRDAVSRLEDGEKGVAIADTPGKRSASANDAGISADGSPVRRAWAC